MKLLLTILHHSTISLTFQLGTVIAPFIVDLVGNSNPNLPPAIFGAIMIISSLVFIFLPETRGQTLLQTVDELNDAKPRSLYGDFKKAINRM